MKRVFVVTNFPDLLREIRTHTVLIKQTSGTNSKENANKIFFSHYGRFRERERLNKFSVLVGCLSGQEEPL